MITLPGGFGVVGDIERRGLIVKLAMPYDINRALGVMKHGAPGVLHDLTVTKNVRGVVTRVLRITKAAEITWERVFAAFARVNRSVRCELPAPTAIEV
jgi:hypothetical protein